VANQDQTTEFAASLEPSPSKEETKDEVVDV
jgi:hypothetical protein